MGTLGAESLSGTDRQELMEQLKQQIAVANAQELINKMTEKCFKKCIDKPGSALDNYEQSRRPDLTSQSTSIYSSTRNAVPDYPLQYHGGQSSASIQ